MTKLTLQQIANRQAAGIGVFQYGGHYIAQAFSSRKTFKTQAAAQNWLNARGLGE